LTALDDENNLISMAVPAGDSMVMSPDSEVPACTAALASTNHDAPLEKIMDFCPEWSYVEVPLTL